VFNRIMKKLGYAPVTKRNPAGVKTAYEDRLKAMPEEAVNVMVRNAFTFARDYYALRGRTILSVDLQTHLDFFNEAVGFDVWDQAEERIVPGNELRN
jgi:hypothetical protein